MSRGRGRGRGGAGGFPSLNTPEGFSITFQEQPLFPKFKYPFRKPATQSQLELLEISSQHAAKLRASPFYLTLEPPAPAIKRYTDKFMVRESNGGGRQGLSLIVSPSEISYFPEELHAVLVDTPRVKAGVKKILNGSDELKDMKARLDVLAKEESAGGVKKSAAGVEDDDDQEEENAIVEDDEEENDYMVDYYDDDMDELGDANDDD